MEPTGRRDPITSARMLAVAVVTAEVVVLAVTGVWLVFFYRPAVHWPNSTPSVLRREWTEVALVRAAHRWVAVLSVPSALAAGVLVVVDARRSRSGWRRGRLALAAGPALPAALAAASLTGLLLPWNQLSLWAVTLSTNIRGYPFVLGPKVRFLLLNGAEVSKSTFRRWFVVHTAVLSAAVGAALLVAWRPRRREGAERGSSPPEPIDNGRVHTLPPP